MSEPPVLDSKDQDPLRLLASAKQAKRPWMEIAGALLSLEASSPLDDNGQPWIKRAEAVSGITVNQLRRMTRTLGFVAALTAAEPELAKKLGWRKFSIIEVIAKIFAADRAAAIKIINENPPGSNFRQLLDKFDDVKRAGGMVSPVSAGKTAAKDFVKQCRIFLGGRGKPLLQSGDRQAHLVRPTLGLSFANPDFLLFQTRGRQIVSIDAVDCYALHGTVDTIAIERRAVQIATESTFFDRFIALVPTGTASRYLPSTIQWLEVPNVTVIDLTMIDDAQRPAWLIEQDLRFVPETGGSRRQAWIKQNAYQLERILHAEGLKLSLPP